MKHGLSITTPIFGARMVEICNALLSLDTDNATKVMGRPDDIKLRSSMTLFSLACPENDLFDCVLAKFFQGDKCQQTIKMLGLAN